ncbi:putative cellular morphogenesis protein (Rax2) [Aspergillus saccharolyticus JOP 1030-1]|uniref:Cellular morphogenesis protein n=1 Tax=Aspergillus saccharolyticus JOP 1030-1 TaxID=1450539 RepID=A0A318ZMQ3_9EURO|nr:cellular morphogenesis protein [Aspergillus saccharolyticus JOP 1030-1]PYH48776.1 cellular morphogenesis protein [Aspergillus saccharolyticus JOP 1030-1]
MRGSSLFGPATAGFAAGLRLSILLLSSLASALTYQSVSEPELDLSPLGHIALTGDFDAVTYYQYTAQTNTSTGDNDAQALLTPLPNGILTTLSTSNADIRAMCPFTQEDGTFSGIFVGGNFTSLGGVKTEGVAIYHPSTNEVTSVSGLSGSVSALLCDQETNSVYVGGNFSYYNTSNAVAWVGTKGWSNLTFGGFNGPVTSILKDSDGHIVFGGSFDGIGNSTSSKNGEQVINLQNATITSDANSSTTGFVDPRNIICQSSGKDGAGKTWLLDDYSPGYWRADMQFEYTPTKLRLYNTHYEGRGTKTFLFRRLPDNGIMNLTYTDPDTGKAAYCDQSCSLSSNATEKYREFTFVNQAAMSGFEIEILSWYGKGAGLNGIELLEDDIFAYAINAFNEPTCANSSYPSKSTRTGSWSATASGQSSSAYLTANVTNSNATDASVIFEPDVKHSGNYSIKLYTPGCDQDDTCSSRGIVNVTITATSDSSDPVQTLIYQTNDYEKYDTIYTGHVDASDSSFRPRVKLTPVANQGDITVVASRVQFVPISVSGTSDDQLNGLYEYNPTTKQGLNVSASAIDQAGLALDSEATITSLASHGSTIYVGGNFSSSSINNIMYVEQDGNATAMAKGGLNAGVSSMTVLNDVLYVGGNFTDTSDGGNDGLSYVAAYSLDTKTWSALGGGLNGRVSSVVSLSLNVSADLNETFVLVSGDFNQLMGFEQTSSTNVSGFAVWVPSRKNWLQNLNVSQLEFAGQLSAYAKVDNTTILAGSLSTGGLAAAGAVALLYDNDLGLEALLSDRNTTGETFTGIFDTSSSRNRTILGGHFSTNATNGSVIENFAIFDGSDGSISGMRSGVDSNSTFLTFMISDEVLYAGGNITGKVGDSTLNGFVLYNLNNDTFVNNQPPRLTGNGVSVNAIAARPSAKEIYFGGQFQTAGALPCPGVCFWDTSAQQWNRPGASLDGTVLALEWLNSKELLVVGNLSINGNQTAIATYKPKGQTWTAFSGASSSDIPGTVTAFTPANSAVSKFWLGGRYNNGSSFLAAYDGSSFQFVQNTFDQGTIIRGLEILPLSKNHDAVSTLNNDQALLVTGHLVIPDFGNASAALYNGTTMAPFILTTKSGGGVGSMSQVFFENKNPYTSGGKHLSNGIVVLISFCLALGCVFLIVICGVIFNKIQRRRQGYMRAPQAVGTDRPSNMRRLPPEYLFNSIKQPNPAAPTI